MNKKGSDVDSVTEEVNPIIANLICDKKSRSNHFFAIKEYQPVSVNFCKVNIKFHWTFIFGNVSLGLVSCRTEESLRP